MNSFEVDCEKFFSIFDIQKYIELANEPINELINRFNINAKTVLSIGAGSAFEEFWFYKNNCKLTIIDLDEQKVLKSQLEKICSTKSNSTLRYITDDASNFKEYLNEKFNVVYISSFTPNELRNRTIRWFYKKPYIGRVLNKILKKTNIHFNSLSWPKNKKPFMDLIERIVSNCLDETGLFIFQSYASGVIADDETYVESIKKQLKSINVRLLEVYCFKSYPNIHLIIGLKEPPDHFIQMDEIIKKNSKITKFHSRGMPMIKFQGIQKIYDFVENKN
ncbi:MAG: hypothetical protein HKM23_06405 [Nitrosopumilus sp.]|nr:hypothetical protein [Nitrosopumilus sp.]NNL58915.1 hypothetical protein [Nitrosopumilus sp.]